MKLRVGRWVRGLTGLLRYGGAIGVHASARVSVQGQFVFGKRVSIGRNSIIQIPADARLILGDGVHIGREVEVSPITEIRIGNFTSVQDRCNFLGRIDIGANCLFAPNVFMSSGTHEIRERPAWLIRDQDALISGSLSGAAESRQRPIQVQDDCWIGINAVVMRGVTIGRGSVIGANSVVTKSVEPYSIVAGAPARLISRRLRFVPPRAISIDDPDHLPYFYSGFDLRQQTISSSPAGYRARGRFQVALDFADARQIELQVTCSEPIDLVCGKQTRRLTVGSQRVAFDIEPMPAPALIEFEASDVRGRPCAVSVRSAGVLT